MKLKRLLLGSLLFVLLVMPIFSAGVLLPAKAQALPADEIDIRLRFTSAARIVATVSHNGNDIEIIMRDSDPMDTELRYRATGDNACPGYLLIKQTQAIRDDSDFNKEPRLRTATTQSSNPIAETDIDFRPDSNSTCQNIGNGGQKIDVEIQNKEAGRAFFAYTSPDVIERVWDAGNYRYSRSADNPQVFIRNSDTDQADCRDFLSTLSNGSSYQMYDIRGGSSSFTPGPAMPTGCRYNTDAGNQSPVYDFETDGYVYSEADRHAFALAGQPLVGLQNIDDDPNNDTGPPGQGGAGENQAPSCEEEGGPLAWIFCPVLNFIDEQLNSLDNTIQTLLEEPPSNLEDDGPLNSAWAVMRNIAYLILVPIMLVMVIGTALGFDFISAYTIKKALPRLIAATLFIALSWELCVFMIELTNNVGRGVKGLITSPFGSIPTSLADLLGGGGGALLFTSIITAGGAGILVLGPALIGILLSYAFVALMAIIIGVFVLTIRQVLILFLILIAPLAILAWIFPGNDKLWKLWWGTFSKLLLMFPLIMGLIAIGRVFAGVADVAGSFDGLLEFTIVLIAYISPYFFIPATFKFAGGIFATVAGMANDRGRGLFDRQRKFRQETAAGRHEQNMQGRSWAGTGRTGRMYRRLAKPQQGLNPTRSGRAKFASNEQIIANQAAAKMLEQDGGRASNNDDATALAVQGGMNANRFINEYMARTGSDRRGAQAALAELETGLGAKIGSSSMRVAAYRARTASTTAYDGSAAGTAQRINEGASLIRSGLISASDATAAGKGNRGRLDISGLGFGAQMQAFSAAAASPGGMTTEQAETYLDETLNAADPGDMLAGNTRTIEALAPRMVERLNSRIAARDAALASGNTAEASRLDIEVDRSLGQIAGVQDNLNRTSPQKAAMFADQVMGVGLMGPHGRSMTVREAIDMASSKPAGANGQQAFLEVRKEYGSARAAYASSANQPPPEPET